VRIERPSSAPSLRLALAVGEGSRFRVEALGPVGGARLVLVFDGTLLRAALPAGQLCGEWRDTAAPLGELTGIALPAPQWLALLLGRLTPADLEINGLTAVESRDGRVVRARLPDNGADDSTVEYDDFRDAPGGELAGAVRLRRKEEGVTLSLRDLRPLAPRTEALALPCPSGFATVGTEAFVTAGAALLGGGE
jgi:hypothetical protein